MARPPEEVVGARTLPALGSQQFRSTKTNQRPAHTALQPLSPSNVRAHIIQQSSKSKMHTTTSETKAGKPNTKLRSANPTGLLLLLKFVISVLVAKLLALELVAAHREPFPMQQQQQATSPVENNNQNAPQTHIIIEAANHLRHHNNRPTQSPQAETELANLPQGATETTSGRDTSTGSSLEQIVQTDEEWRLIKKQLEASLNETLSLKLDLQQPIELEEGTKTETAPPQTSDTLAKDYRWYDGLSENGSVATSSTGATSSPQINDKATRGMQQVLSSGRRLEPGRLEANFRGENVSEERRVERGDQVSRAQFYGRKVSPTISVVRKEQEEETLGQLARKLRSFLTNYRPEQVILAAGGANSSKPVGGLATGRLEAPVEQDNGQKVGPKLEEGPGWFPAGWRESSLFFGESKEGASGRPEMGKETRQGKRETSEEDASSPKTERSQTNEELLKDQEGAQLTDSGAELQAGESVTCSPDYEDQATILIDSPSNGANLTAEQQAQLLNGPTGDSLGLQQHGSNGSQHFSTPSQCLPAGSRMIEVITKIITPILFGIIIVVGLLGNIIVMLVILEDRKTERELTPTNLLILDLSLADLSFIIFCIPFTGWDYAVGHWMFGQIWCKFNQYLIVVCALSSIYTLVLMSIDRFMAIVYPIECINYRTSKNMLHAIYIKWILILLIAFPTIPMHGLIESPLGPDQYNCRFLSDQYNPLQFQIVFFVTSYLSPLVLIFCLYLSLLNKLWFGTKPHGHKESHKMLESKKRVTWLVACIVIVFALCWCPIQIMLILMRLKTHKITATYVAIQVFAHILGYMNSCVNPIVYAFASETFNQSFKRSWFGRTFWRCMKTCCCCCVPDCCRPYEPQHQSGTIGLGPTTVIGANRSMSLANTHQLIASSNFGATTTTRTAPTTTSATIACHSTATRENNGKLGQPRNRSLNHIFSQPPEPLKLANSANSTNDTSLDNSNSSDKNKATPQVGGDAGREKGLCRDNSSLSAGENGAASGRGNQQGGDSKTLGAIIGGDNKNASCTTGLTHRSGGSSMKDFGSGRNECDHSQETMARSYGTITRTSPLPPLEPRDRPIPPPNSVPILPPKSRPPEEADNQTNCSSSSTIVSNQREPSQTDTPALKSNHSASLSWVSSASGSAGSQTPTSSVTSYCEHAAHAPMCTSDSCLKLAACNGAQGQQEAHQEDQQRAQTQGPPKQQLVARVVQGSTAAKQAVAHECSGPCLDHSCQN